MKKFLAFMLVVLASATLLFAINEQRIISVDSSLYKEIETLYILQGKALPSSSGPWSEGEMRGMLSLLDREALGVNGKALYDKVLEELNVKPTLTYSDNISLDFGLELNGEGYFHTNTEDFIDEDDWVHGFTSRKAPVKFTFEAWPVENFYGYFEFTLQDNIGYNVGYKGKDGRYNLLYKNAFNINIPIVNALLFSMPQKDGSDHLFADFDWSVPYRAFASVGGEHWNIMAGRDKLSWGNGESGNLMLSSTFPTHNLVRFNTYFNSFKYSLVTSFFPGVDSEESQYRSLEGYKALIVHRLEFDLFSNKLNITINEACMYWSSKAKPNFSLMQINPFGFMHNEYVAGNGNSLLVFEANYTPLNGVNIYAQYAIDEFAGPGEGRTNPAATGILLGIKGATESVGGGILRGSLEFVKTDPLLYIRGLHYVDEPTKNYGYDAFFRPISSDRIIIMSRFTTYPYGNDTIYYGAKAEYEIPSKAKFNLGLSYLIRGSMSNPDAYWHQYNDEYNDAPDLETPTTFNPFDPDDYDATTNTVKREHGVEKSFIITLGGEYNILPSLSVYAVADFLFVQNVNHTSGNSGNDLQLSFGISYSL